VSWYEAITWIQFYMLSYHMLSYQHLARQL
jgi:hypothetical protein